MANEQNLTPFEAGNTASVGHGRPKKFVSTVLDELKGAGYVNIKRAQVVDIYETLWGMTQGNLVELVKNSDTPVVFRIIAKAMLSNKGFDVIETMLDRTQGKATMRTELTGGDGTPLTTLVKFIGRENES